VRKRERVCVYRNGISCVSLCMCVLCVCVCRYPGYKQHNACKSVDVCQYVLSMCVCVGVCHSLICPHVYPHELSVCVCVCVQEWDESIEQADQEEEIVVKQTDMPREMMNAAVGEWSVCECACVCLG
jgi:hypothetical protein